ncbi:MAG TPA: Na/Pi cotransporter family protein [Alphaproteobacteria bacterium]|nr:Na/Pi cotransporter family protein [Alphaproteobacteria bacterium]HNS45443.1 Na/Pi cotransporter family protein [Alphaproteobacteria bacterium]
MPSLVLLHIIGGVCLLLFGLRLVRNGVTRAYGVQLRKVISSATRNRILAALAGVGVTAMLQSSTATTMIISSFAGQGLITTTAALAVVLGADVGTTLVAQLLTFDLSWLSPVLIIFGYMFYSVKDQASVKRQIGRIFVGLGLMLLALTVIKHEAGPLKDSDVLPVMLAPLDHDPVFSVLVGAVLTWMFHSSLAIVLLLMSMVHTEVVPLHLALMLVLGANIGNVVAPMISSLKDPPQAARIPAGNLIMRLVGVFLVLASLKFIMPHIDLLGDNEARVVVNFHMAFNIALCILFLPLLNYVTKFVTKAIPDKAKNEGDGVVAPQYLDERVLDTPTVALTNAAREVLRIADMTDQMLQMVWSAFQKGDHGIIDKIRDTDEKVDLLYKALKSYLVRITGETMTEAEGKRHFQILNFATNIEHVGDIIDRNLLGLAEKRLKANANFSVEGKMELDNLFQLVIDSVRLAQTVFISGDVRLARQLVEDKTIIKNAEKQASMNHLVRLQKGVPETIATSDLHMDIIRDLRRINSLMTAIAYPILDDAGELRRSLLINSDEVTEKPPIN